MKDKNIVHYTRKTLPEGKTDWEKLSDITEEDLENPLWTKKMLTDTTVYFPRKKISVHMYLDQDIIDWFKSEGKGYQTRINAVLKSYINHQI